MKRSGFNFLGFLRSAGTLQRLALYVVCVSQLALGVGCRQEGGVKSASSQNASTATVTVSIGEIVYQVVKANVEASTAPEAPQQLTALQARHDVFVSAVDLTIPPEVRNDFKTTFQEIIALVRDGTLPALTSNLASVLALLADDPQDPQDHRLQALVTLAGQRSALDREAVMRLASRLVAYPELDTLLSSIAQLVHENDGVDAQGNPTGLERDLITDLLRTMASVLKDLERPQQSSTQTQSALVDTLLSPIDLRGSQVGGPAWAVRVDANGNPQVARRSDGRLHFPFVDLDGDGAADVNADGAPVDANGTAIEISAFGTTGVRDSAGRALADTGDLLYDYFDVKKTPLGQAAHMAGDMTRADVPFRTVAAFDRLAARTTRTDATTGRPYTAYTDDNPLTDLMWNGLEVFRYRDAPKLLDASAALIKNDPVKAERLMVKLVEAIDILRNTPSAAPSATVTTQDSVLDDLQPLLDQAFEKMPARQLLQTFSTEQRRLRNLPMGFARMMRYSDWLNRVPTSPGQVSMFERLLDMIEEANQCDSWPFGNMAEFYLEAMAGNKRILGITINVSTIHLLLDISFLRSLLCSQISEANVRALAAFSQSGALDALTPIVKDFVDAGEVETLKDIFLALQASYPQDMRPHEAAIIQLLESGAVELLFEVFDDMNHVTVPGTGEKVSDAIADFLEAIVDDERTVRDRHGVQHASLLHLLVAPLEPLSQRIGSDPALEQALDQAFHIALATVVMNGEKKLQNHGLIPLTASALESFADSMSIYPWVRNDDITEFQQTLEDLMTGPELPVLVDTVLTVERSSAAMQIKAAIANVLTPNVAGNHDIFASVLEIGAAALQQKTDPQALVDLLKFAGRALDPDRGWSRDIVLGAVKLLDGEGGPTIVALLRNGLDRGPQGAATSPLETILDVLDEVLSAGSVPQPTTVASIREGLHEIVDFIRDDQQGLQRIFDNILSTQG